MSAKSKLSNDIIEGCLLKYLKPNDTVYTILKSVSQSGMYRHIQVIAIKDNQPIDLTRWVAQYSEWPYKEKTNGVGVSGCGMDMGFHLVYTLSYDLFDDGYALKHSWL